MEEMEASKLSTKRLDHYGIVAGVCQEIELIEQIDKLIEPMGRKVTVGEAVQAMVVNGLGFVGRPLYLTPEFYENKPVEQLIGPGIEAKDLNDDSLGRALDRLYQRGITEVFAQVSAHALRVMGIQVRFAHLDTTAFSLQGEYEIEEESEEGAEPIRITYGYSKDHRPDLKQAILSLICANRSSLPVWLNALSGNTSDKSSFPEIAQEYLKQFGAEEETPYLVADSALYSEDNLKALSEVKWVTRVPATITKARQLRIAIDKSQMQAWETEGYFIYEQKVTYGGIEQRWLLVLYEPNQQREWKQIDRRIGKERKQAEKALKRLSRQEFACEPDAQAALKHLEKKWKFHQVTGIQTWSEAHYAQPGRPGPDAQPTFTWRVNGEIATHTEHVEDIYAAAGKYIIATNELDSVRLPTVDLLTIYKDQNRTAERGFRFLKDPFFLAQRFFIKKPSRIMALLMIMGISLLVYTIAELTLRQQLAEHDETLPDQRGYPTQRPTMRRIFQVFEGIDLLFVQEGNQQQVLILNLRDIHRHILGFFGVRVRKMYGLA
jgi:transposase